jgi:predicted porin
MTKKLLVAAIASAFAAPAFAATPNVNVYGLFKMSVDFVNGDQVSTPNGDSAVKVSSNSSRIGFNGNEDLGGGVSAVWQVESVVAVDGGGSTIGVRNTFLGLKSKGLGQVILGNMDTPYKSSTLPLDVFGDTIADYNAIVGAVTGAGVGTAGSGSNAFDVRETNTIRYDSPTVSGFTLSAAYGARNEAGATTSDPALYSLAAVYKNGPLFGSLAYEVHKDAAPGVDPSGVKLGVGFTLGSLSLGGIYEQIDGDGIAAITRDAYYLSAAYKVGAITLKGAYGMAGESDLGADTGANFYAIGLDYALSKRTSLFAIYAEVDNDSLAAYDLGAIVGSSASTASANGESPAAFSLGVAHSF